MNEKKDKALEAHALEALEPGTEIRGFKKLDDSAIYAVRTTTYDGMPTWTTDDGNVYRTRSLVELGYGWAVVDEGVEP